MPANPEDGQTLHELLRAAAQEQGSATALIEPGRHATYGDYASNAQAFSDALVEEGVKRGDRVAIILPNCLEFCYAVLGASEAGAISVLVNPRYTRQELTHVLEDSTPSAIVVCRTFAQESQLKNVQAVYGDRPVRPPIYLVDDNPLAEDRAVKAFPQAAAPLGTSPGPSAPAQTRSPVKEHDPALVIYTSGTTGRPKGALLSHRNLVCSARGYGGRLGVTSNDRLSAFTPMCHAGGMINGVLTALWGRATAVLTRRFSPDIASGLLVEHGVTIYLAVPTMLIQQMQADGVAQQRFRSLRAVVSGGAPVKPDLVRSTVEFFDLQTFHVVYGLSEANMATLSSTIEESAGEEPTVGRPTEGFEIQIVDCNRNALAAGEIGEVAIRGCGVFLGYWQNEQATRSCLSNDGWLFTGDLGHLNDDGTLAIVGRLKDMYIQGGTNVYPAEIEQVLEQHPAVSIAAVVGRPHPTLGEVGYAFVVLRRNQDIAPVELLEFATQQLAPFKIPHELSIRDSLPTTPFGKIEKAALHAELEQI